jgi:hypothetical protein
VFLPWSTFWIAPPGRSSFQPRSPCRGSSRACGDYATLNLVAIALRFAAGTAQRGVTRGERTVLIDSSWRRQLCELKREAHARRLAALTPRRLFPLRDRI